MKIDHLKSNKTEQELAEQALIEMAPLEAGFMLRDLGLNFPTTMDAVKQASKKLNIKKSITSNKDRIRSLGIFSNSDITKSKKLEITKSKTNTIYTLRGEFNKVIDQRLK